MHRLLTALALTAGLLTYAPPVRGEVSEEFHQTLPLAADGSLEIANVNGSVTIRAWDREEIDVQAVKTAKNNEALHAIRIDVESRRGVVEISAHLPNRGDASVSYEISLPRGASVDAEAVNGPLVVRGVEGLLDLEAVNGALTVEAAKGPIDAATVNGALTVGYVDVSGAPLADLESVNGELTVFLPATTTGSFSADTVNGGIETDFPLEVTKARFGPMRSLEGRLGEGGGRFDMETVNGRIRILNNENVEARVLKYHLEQVESRVVEYHTDRVK